jgi:hypothetical protein
MTSAFDECENFSALGISELLSHNASARCNHSLR